MMGSVLPFDNPEAVNRVVARLMAYRQSSSLGVLLRLGVCTGFRVSDLLNLKVKDIRHLKLTVTEKKTKKRRVVPLDAGLRRFLLIYVKTNKFDDERFLFSNNGVRPFQRQFVYRKFRDAAAAEGVEGIGSHSMRKTYALNEYRKHQNIEKLRKDLGHKYASTTIGYVLHPSLLSSLVKPIGKPVK